MQVWISLQASTNVNALSLYQKKLNIMQESYSFSFSLQEDIFSRFPGPAQLKEANGRCCIPNALNSIYLFKCELGIFSLGTGVGVKERRRKVRWLAYNKGSDTVRKRTQHLLLLKTFLPHKVNISYNVGKTMGRGNKP